jgi:hypothetical protein
MSRAREGEGCLGCLLLLSLAGGALLEFVLPWFGVVVPRWVLVADLAAFAAVGLALAVIRGMRPPDKGPADADKGE